ncbi:MAG TPA: hypothetical protein VFX65_00980 [Candidatus Limnocylindrales bacterium]|nr:hypothetical protein [Candidatus Limnocylindrales bacterium]
MDRTRAIRTGAAGAALVAAALYFLIAAGVLDIGESTNGEDPGLFEFGAFMGVIFVGVALALLQVRSRLVWAGVAILQVIVLVGYVAAAQIRIPAFEAWGLLIKACQLAILGAVGYLLLARRSGELRR